MNIVDRIKKLQQDKEGKISLNALEKVLGFGKSTIASWEKKQPSADKLQKVADYFSVSTDYLLGRTDNPSPNGEVFALSSDTPYDELPPEALEEIENFKQFVLQKYKKKD